MSETLELDPLPQSVPSFAGDLGPAGRDAGTEIRRKMAAIAAAPLLRQILDAMPNMAMVLNANCQIVAANERLLETLGGGVEEVVEKRTGGALRCIHAADGPDGCGTGLHCATCGAAAALSASAENHAQAVRECRVLAHGPGGVVAMDLRVTATHFRLEDDDLILAAIEDIGREKRLAVFQHVFFHDVLNTAGCIQGYVDYLAADPASDREASHRLIALSAQLIEEIESQQDLLSAEAGELKTQSAPLQTHQLLRDLRSQYLKRPAAEEREIVIGAVWEGTIVADRRLLLRVLGNMLKNALEAAAPGGAVTLACANAGDAVAFTVHNPEVIPEAVQLKIFQRSFSTKGETGRGIGAYSMKLFGERCLGGEVGFASASPEGTTFRLLLPKTPPPAR